MDDSAVCDRDHHQTRMLGCVVVETVRATGDMERAQPDPYDVSSPPTSNVTQAIHTDQ